MNGGRLAVVGVGLALILVIAVAIAAFIWRERILDRRRTPDERYRRAVLDVRWCRLTSGVIAAACAPANRIRQSPAGQEEREGRSDRVA